MSRGISLLTKVVLLSVCALCVFYFFGILSEYRRSAMKDAESQAALKLLAEKHFNFVKDKNILQSYLLELESIKKEHSGIWFIRDYVDELQRIAKTQEADANDSHSPP